MNKFLMAALFCFTMAANAQKGCEYSVNEKEDGKEVKTTKDYLMYENVFGGASNFVFFSLTISDGVPLLNFQLLSKSKDFPKAYCLDKTSKIFLQLTNGKVITLINGFDERCSGLVYDEAEKNNIRVLSSSFLFTKGSLEELEKTPISFIRVKYSTEVVDYSIRKELASEAMNKTYYPESYFITNLKCIQQ